MNNKKVLISCIEYACAVVIGYSIAKVAYPSVMKMLKLGKKATNENTIPSEDLEEDEIFED